MHDVSLSHHSPYVEPLLLVGLWADHDDEVQVVRLSMAKVLEIHTTTMTGFHRLHLVRRFC